MKLTSLFEHNLRQISRLNRVSLILQPVKNPSIGSEEVSNRTYYNQKYLQYNQMLNVSDSIMLQGVSAELVSWVWGDIFSREIVEKESIEIESRDITEEVK